MSLSLPVVNLYPLTGVIILYIEWNDVPGTHTPVGAALTQ